MTTHSLRELYIDELRDLYSAESQLLEALPKMATAASAAQLKQAFNEHLEQTRVHRERLDLIFKQLDTRPEGERCEGMAGLIREGQHRITLDGPAEVRDAALISAAQRVEHYEIAAYGSARTFARRLGDWESERLLQQTLDEEGAADHRLTSIAEGGINEAATDRNDTLLNERWSRLRFLDIDDLDRRALDYSDVKVRGTADDDLGELDGFIVDGANGRPLYYVVDSGGWFVGRRYLVPVGKGRFDSANKQLVIDLTKDQVQRKPEFSTNAFMAMSDDEIRRYERRVLSALNPEAARQASYWEAYERLPEYQEPDWLKSDAWSGYGYRRSSGTGRSVGSLASPETSWPGESSSAPIPAPSAAGHEVLPSVGATSHDPQQDEVVVAHEEESRRRDPRDNTAPGSKATTSDLTRGVTEDAPGRRMDDDDLAR
jgi:ferritin-like metal-binding protein YciE